MSSDRQMRVLVLSADVAGGHDAAARTIVNQVRETYPDAVAEVQNGLTAFGPMFHRVIRDGYRLQIQVASGSYGLMLWLVGTRMMTTVIRRLIGWKGRRRTVRMVRKFDPTVIVATYALPAMVLSELRRRGQLRVPVLEVTTDPDPHPLVVCPHLDGLLVCTPGDASAVVERLPRLNTRVIAPPVASRFLQPIAREAARERLGMADEQRPVVLVSGGAWAVGDMTGIIDALAADGRARVLALCADNDRLRRELSRRHDPSQVEALEFRRDMPDLLAAADAVVHTGAGVTGFEALAMGTPLLLMNPIPGHGERSARALQRYGLARYVQHAEELVELVRDPVALRAATEGQRLAGLSLYQAGSVAQAVDAAGARRVSYRRRYITRRLAGVAVAMTAAIAVSGEAESSNNALAHGFGVETHIVKCVPFHHGPLKRHREAPWFPRSC